MLKNSTHQSGFTLIELVVVIALMLIVGAMISEFVLGGSDSARYVGESSTAGTRTAMLAEILNRDLRSVASPGRLDSTDTTSALRSQILTATNSSFWDIPSVSDDELWLWADALRSSTNEQDCVHYVQVWGAAHTQRVRREVYRDATTCPTASGTKPTESSVLLQRTDEAIAANSPLFLFDFSFNPEALSSPYQFVTNSCTRVWAQPWSARPTTGTAAQMRNAIVGISINADNQIGASGGQSKASIKRVTDVYGASIGLPITSRLTPEYQYALGCSNG